MKIKKILISLSFALLLASASVPDIHATENERIFIDTKNSRGATDIYYQVIDYSIKNETAKVKDLKQIVNVGFDLEVNLDFVKLKLSAVSIGTYQVYRHKADFYVRAYQFDAMGHNLGIVTLVRKNITVYTYQRL